MSTDSTLTITTADDQIPVTFSERGDGRPVLLLHGGAGPASVTGFADLLAERTGARVITPTHPGFGGTPRPAVLATVAGLAELYVGLLDALELHDVTVIGNSLGGWIAAELALRHSPRVGRLALVDAVGIEVAAHPVADFFALTPAQIAEHSYYDPSTAAIPDPTTLPPAARQIALGNRDALAVYGGAMTDSGLLPRLRLIDVPALVLWGEADRIADPDYGRAYAAAIPGARFFLLEHAGHVPQIETPGALLSAVEELVSSFGSRFRTRASSVRAACRGTTPSPSEARYGAGMRAVVVDAVRGRPEVREVPRPSAPDGGVVVQVRATGMCRSDWHAWAGHDDIVFPHVPGHELAGVVTEVGAGVTRWAMGDRVTVPFVCGCGRCDWCRGGNAQVCPDQQQPGFTHRGSFAEYVALHAADTNLVAIPEQVDFTTAASLGCRFATAYRALASRARLAAGEWVTVVGAGGVGLSTVMIAHALGARVVAVDRNPDALAVAARLGADHTVLAAEGDVPATIAELTGGGSHVAVDAVGSERTCTDAIHCLRRRGRHVQIGLLPPVDGHPRVPMDRVIAWELDVLGSHGMAAADYPAMMALIEQGRLRPDQLIGRTIGLEEAAAALPTWDRATSAGITIVDVSR